MLSFDAVIFDMDGVITNTVNLHSMAWKRMFDEYLRYRATAYNELFCEFDRAGEYLSYVDGRPRYKGVEAFLKSREINIPFGNPEDKPEKETICGLGNRKDKCFHQLLEVNGVAVYASTIRLIHELLARGVKVGVATSSKNCEVVLKRAGISDLFETWVDGVVSANLGLNGKPEPDIFTTASDNLKVKPNRAIIIEDAVSGVQAGFKGNFGLVIGVARENHAEELKTNGADAVVADLAEVTVDKMNELFRSKLSGRQSFITLNEIK